MLTNRKSGFNKAILRMAVLIVLLLSMAHASPKHIHDPDVSNTFKSRLEIESLGLVLHRAQRRRREALVEDLACELRDRLLCLGEREVHFVRRLLVHRGGRGICRPAVAMMSR